MIELSVYEQQGSIESGPGIPSVCQFFYDEFDANQCDHSGIRLIAVRLFIMVGVLQLAAVSDRETVRQLADRTL